MHQGKDKRMKGTKPATDRKRDRRKRSIKIATWNVQAKASHLGDIEIIASDMRNRGISICCIQETQNSSDASILLEHNDYIIFLGRQEDNNGGLAFYMTNEWKDRLYSIRKITERIATATFKYNVNGKDKYLTIMNVYGYTQMRSKDEPQLVQQFYKELEEAYDYERRSTDIIMIAGDFNAKLGRRELGEETIMGNYGIGNRNTNGEELAEFLVKTGIYPANTHFKHRKMQIATWHGGRPAAKSRKPLERRNPGLHNQIDYMLVTRRNIRLVTNCRAIVPHVFQHRSDHSMVEMVIEVGALYKMTARKRNGIDKRCMTALQDPTFKERYHMEVARRLERISGEMEEGGIVNAYGRMKEAVKEAAAAVLPPADRRIQGRVRYMSDHILKELSNRQKRLTVKIYGKSMRTADQIADLKARRKEIFKEMRTRMKNLYIKKMDQNSISNK
jgi:exonuclease III